MRSKKDKLEKKWVEEKEKRMRWTRSWPPLIALYYPNKLFQKLENMSFICQVSVCSRKRLNLIPSIKKFDTLVFEVCWSYY